MQTTRIMDVCLRHMVPLLWLFMVMVMGCGRTAVAPVCLPITDTAGVSIPQPDRILVYDFAVSADDVSLDRAVDVQLVHHLEGVSQTAEQLKIGRDVARALTNELVTAIRKLGLPAQPATDASVFTDRTLVIQGQFVSIDEGNSLGRMLIGLGFGATEVKTLVQVYTVNPPERKLLHAFETTARSSRTPGMAETAGVGVAAMGAQALAVGTGLAVGAAQGESVSADARRTAKAVVKKLSSLFASLGWITAPG